MTFLWLCKHHGLFVYALQQFSHTFSVFSDGPCSSWMLINRFSSILKNSYHKKVLLLLIALSRNASSTSMQWVSAAVFLRCKQNLMQVLCSLKLAFTKSQKCYKTLQKCKWLKKTISHYYSSWHTNSQSVLFAHYSMWRLNFLKFQVERYTLFTICFNYCININF